MESRLDDVLDHMDHISSEKNRIVKTMNHLNSLHGRLIREYDTQVLTLREFLIKESPIHTVMQRLEKIDLDRDRTVTDLKIARARYKELVKEYNEAAREMNMLTTRLMLQKNEKDRQKFLVMHETRPGGPEYHRLMSDLSTGDEPSLPVPDFLCAY